MNFYPHHIGDYLTATAHLSWAEDCAYRRLLDVYYSREAAIPADVAQACRLVRAASKDERKAVETVLREFFTETPDGWKHSRCEAEIVKAAEAAERARTNGKKGGRPPKQQPTDNPEKTQPVISGNPDESKSKAPNPITNTNTKNTPPTPRKRRVGFDPEKLELPDWLEPDDWLRWCADRRARGKPITEEGARQQFAKLADLRQQGHTPTAVISHCIASGYQGLFAPPKSAQPTVSGSAWFETRQGVERKAASLGIAPYVEVEEQWPTYRARVMMAAKEQSKSVGLNLDQLAAMAAQRSGVAA